MHFLKFIACTGCYNFLALEFPNGQVDQRIIILQMQLPAKQISPRPGNCIGKDLLLVPDSPCANKDKNCLAKIAVFQCKSQGGFRLGVI